MDGGTRFFWALLALLLGASVFFGVRTEQKRRALRNASTATAAP